MSQSQYDQLLGMINAQQIEIDHLDTRVDALEVHVPPPPGIVVDAAPYWVTGNTAQVADFKARVIEMWATGPFKIWPGMVKQDLSNDPFPGQNKTLEVSWTRDGVPHKKQYPDFNMIVDLAKDN